MSAHPLATRVALVLGVERPAGRAAAVALAEAGADVAVVTLTEDTRAEFAANSVANEFWALGRRGIALTSDGGAASVRVAIAEAGVQLGPVAILVCVADEPIGREALSGLRSDPAIVVVIDSDATPAAARSLLAWTRTLAEAGLRANAVVPSRVAADATGPALKEHHSLDPMDLAGAVVYLASDASAAVEGAMVVAEG